MKGTGEGSKNGPDHGAKKGQSCSTLGAEFTELGTSRSSRPIDEIKSANGRATRGRAFFSVVGDGAPGAQGSLAGSLSHSPTARRRPEHRPAEVPPMGRRTRVAPSSCPLIIGSLFVCHIFFVALVSLKGLTSYADTAASQNPRGLFFWALRVAYCETTTPYEYHYGSLFFYWIKWSRFVLFSLSPLILELIFDTNSLCFTPNPTPFLYAPFFVYLSGRATQPLLLVSGLLTAPNGLRYGTVQNRLATDGSLNTNPRAKRWLDLNRMNEVLAGLSYTHRPYCTSPTKVVPSCYKPSRQIAEQES